MPPIIERELRLALTRARAVEKRFIFASIGAAMSLLSMLIAMGGQSHEMGQFLFRALLALSCYAAIIQTAGITSDFLSQERRNKTLGLLFLTGMRVSDLFAGKLAGALLICLCNILAVVPFFAVPFLMGGTSLSAFLSAACLLPNLLLLTVALSLLGSTLYQDDAKGLLVASGTAALLCLLTPAIYYNLVIFAGRSPAKSMLLWSPAYGVAMVGNLFVGYSWKDFLTNSSITLSYSLIAVALAGWILRRSWRENGSEIKPRWLANACFWIPKQPRHATSNAADHLDVNPYGWLYHRYQNIGAGWLVLACSIVAWAVLEWLRSRWTLPIVRFAAAGIVNGLIGWLSIFAAAQRAAEDRRSGAFELLLTGSLTVDQIVEVLCRSPLRQFRRLFVALAGFNLWLMLGGFFVKPWSNLGLLSYVCCWGIFLGLGYGMMHSSLLGSIWVAINSGRPLYSAFKRFRLAALTAPSMIISGPLLYRSTMSFSIEELALFASVGLMFTIACCLCFVPIHKSMKERIKGELRAIAREPVPEPSDPRFRRWKIQERFPFEND